MIPIPNHHLWWGRNEVVRKLPRFIGLLWLPTIQGGAGFLNPLRGPKMTTGQIPSLQTAHFEPLKSGLRICNSPYIKIYIYIYKLIYITIHIIKYTYRYTYHYRCHDTYQYVYQYSYHRAYHNPYHCTYHQWYMSSMMHIIIHIMIHMIVYIYIILHIIANHIISHPWSMYMYIWYIMIYN